jgi:tight adherence protein B
MSHPELLVVLSLVVVLAAAWVMAAVAERRRRALQARLAAVVVTTPQATVRGDTALSLRRGTPSRTALRLRLLPGMLHHRFAEELSATGDRLRPAQLAITALAASLLVAALSIVVLEWPISLAFPFVLVSGIAAVATHLRMAQRRFQERFVEIFPDALDVIVRAVRAGLPVLDAIESTIANVPEPVAGEFRRLLDEMRIGVDLEDVLEHAANRIRVNDFRFFAVTLLLQRRTGGSLADTLVNLAGLIRRRKEIRLKARALSAESRATAYLLGVLPFVMIGIMYLINPGLISLLFTDPRGKVMLSIGIGMLIFGFIAMRAMIKKALR